MGLDIGDKTVGVAVSDPLFISANGVTTIERVGVRKDTGRILDLVREYEVSLIVAGLPLMLDGSDSPQTEKVREFVRVLGNKLMSSGLSKVAIVYQDERFTTKMAESVLIEANMRREKRREIIDRQAAVIILQSYLDSHREGLPQ